MCYIFSVFFILLDSITIASECSCVLVFCPVVLKRDVNKALSSLAGRTSPHLHCCGIEGELKENSKQTEEKGKNKLSSLHKKKMFSSLRIRFKMKLQILLYFRYDSRRFCIFAVFFYCFSTPRLYREGLGRACVHYLYIYIKP